MKISVVFLFVKIQLIILLLTINSGCSSLISSSNKVLLHEGVYYHLLSPPVALYNKTQIHLISATIKDEKKQFVVQIEYEKQKISLAAVSLSGMPLFDLVWRANGEIKQKQYIPIPSFDINVVLTDIQWLSWPLNYLKTGVVGDNIDIKEEFFFNEQQKGWRRIVKHNNIVVFSISKNEDNYHIEHFFKGYALDIRDLSEGQ